MGGGSARRAERCWPGIGSRSPAAVACGGCGGHAQAQHDCAPAHGERAASRGPARGDVAGGEAFGGGCAAALDPGDAGEVELWRQERAGSEAAHGASARPAGRRRRAWSHAAAGAGEEDGTARSTADGPGLRDLRRILCGERFARFGDRRSGWSGRTSACFGGGAGGGPATARRRRERCRRRRLRGCSRTRRTASASGRASCTSAMPVSGRSTGSRHG